MVARPAPNASAWISLRRLWPTSTHRIRAYGLPEPECARVADAEHLPFESNHFDLGYSWGVLHHTPDTEQSIRELARVVRSGGEFKIMLYNRRSLCSFLHWVKYALLRGRPWRGFRYVLWHHLESPGTKAYTRCEVRRMLSSAGLTGIQIETFATSFDHLPWNAFPARILNLAIDMLIGLTRNRLGFFHCITARKP